MNLENLKNEDIFRYFLEISSIPRCSRNEGMIADYLEKFAAKNSLHCTRDKADNIIIKRITENDSYAALQAHVDMVCIKLPQSGHDFSKDPLDVIITENSLMARNTTLGADNGIGVAYMLALLADHDYIGPSLECIFTSNEEDGMTGADYIDISDLKSRYLINLDSEEEGKLYVSSAGGAIFNFIVPVSYKMKNGSVYEITISGLTGGHSGLEIHKKRGNAIKQAARILNYLQEENIGFRLIDIRGGKKHNAIPEEATIRIMLKNGEQKESLIALVHNCENIFQKEQRKEDPNVKVSIDFIEEKSQSVFSKSTTITLVGLLNLLPDGPVKMSSEMEGLVETSSNVATISVSDGIINVDLSVRSSKDAEIDNLSQMFKQLKTAFNIGLKESGHYPGWTYEKSSVLKDKAKVLYRSTYGREIEEIAIHAGLECGFFKNKKADLEIISLGPTIRNIHTAEESVDIDSVRRVYDYLKALLKALN